MVPEHPWMHRIRILVLVLGLFCLVTRVPCRAEPLTIMADGILAGASRHLSLAGGEPGRTWTLAFEVPATIAGKGSPAERGLRVEGDLVIEAERLASGVYTVRVGFSGVSPYRREGTVSVWARKSQCSPPADPVPQPVLTFREYPRTPVFTWENPRDTLSFTVCDATTGAVIHQEVFTTSAVISPFGLTLVPETPYRLVTTQSDRWGGTSSPSHHLLLLGKSVEPCGHCEGIGIDWSDGDPESAAPTPPLCLACRGTGVLPVETLFMTAAEAPGTGRRESSANVTDLPVRPILAAHP